MNRDKSVINNENFYATPFDTRIIETDKKKVVAVRVQRTAYNIFLSFCTMRSLNVPRNEMLSDSKWALIIADYFEFYGRLISLDLTSATTNCFLLSRYRLTQKLQRFQ